MIILSIESVRLLSSAPPGPTLLACSHPALTQSECEENVPTAYKMR